MGLDVSAFSKAVLIEGLTDVEEYEEKYDWRTHHFVSNSYLDANWRFSEWAEDLKPGVYRVDGETHGFRAGSYRGYNEWREWLCLLTLDTVPKVVWKDPDAYRNGRFFRLINFSDCEGYIGPRFSKLLAIDFAMYQKRADDSIYEEWFKQKYADWRKAFELAADGGYVDFH